MNVRNSVGVRRTKNSVGSINLSQAPLRVITSGWSAVLVMFECLLCGQWELPRESPVVGGEHGLSAQMEYEVDVQMVEGRGRFAYTPKSHVDHIGNQGSVAEALTIPKGWQ